MHLSLLALFLVLPSGTHATHDPDHGLHYFAHDHLHSSTIATDTDQTLAQKIAYLPFGSERVNEKSGDFGTRFTFTDQEWDNESGLLYFDARYYHPELAPKLKIPNMGKINPHKSPH